LEGLMKQLFDAHCHLQDERLRPHLEAILQRAANAGVATMMCCGSCEADWPDVQALARRHAQIRASYGLHPWYVGERTADWFQTLRTFLTDNAAAVGEIGLDHALDKRAWAAQDEVFTAQLELAQELNRPASVHCRRAWGRMLELLDQCGVPKAGLLFHSYSGARDLVAELARRGAYFSFSGAITHERNVSGKEAAAVVPLERLLIETDTPDLLAELPAATPVVRDADGKPLSEPAHLIYVLRQVATIRGLSEEEIADRTWANAAGLFGLAQAF
jgi:TatD DNase family protein